MSEVPSRSELLRKVREIVARNKEYFNAKIRVSENQKPFAGQLHHEHKTPSSTYGCSFVPPLSPPQRPVRSPLKGKDLEDNIQTTAPCPLFAETSYKNFFRTEPQLSSQLQLSPSKSHFSVHHSPSPSHLSFAAAAPSFESESSPRYLATQNNMAYLNWGGNLQATAMPPAVHSGATNLPFTSASSYKCQFKPHALPKVERTALKIKAVGGKHIYCESSYRDCFRSSAKNKLATLNYHYREKYVKKIGKVGESDYKGEYTGKARDYVLRSRDRTLEELQAIVLRM